MVLSLIGGVPTLRETTLFVDDAQLYAGGESRFGLVHSTSKHWAGQEMLEFAAVGGVHDRGRGRKC